jgi:3'-5' exonuclease
MNKLFFDIETLPTEKERQHILKELHAELAKSHEEDGKTYMEFEEYLSKTCFDGAFGRICCISYAMNDEPIQTLKGDETEMLKNFWRIAKMAHMYVGFNIMGFDLRFIYQRSIILRVKPSVEIPFARYRNFPIYDIYFEWSKWDMRPNISLHRLAVALGIPSSKGGEVEGKNVAKAFEEGKVDEICKYCEKDVEVTRAIYKKMTFED